MVATRERRTGQRDPKWTRRQHEVLELLAKGYTNPRIAEHLGISLDGAKWHVAEILDRLDVSSREEAADYWRERNGLRPRLARLAGAVTGAFSLRWLGWAAAAMGVLALGALAGLVVATRAGDEPELVDDLPTAGAESPSPIATAPGGAGATQTPPPRTPQAETIAGAPVRQWKVNAATLPNEELVVFLERGCTQCDGPADALERAAAFVQGTTTTVLVEALIAGERPVYLHSMWVSPGGAEQWASLCQTGNCGPLGTLNAESTTRLMRSVDGGATWLHVGDIKGTLSIVGRQGGTLIAVRWTWETQRFAYETYPGGTAIDPPREGLAMAAVLDNGFLWQAPNDATIFADDGTIAIDASWDSSRDPAEYARLASPATGPAMLVEWQRGQNQHMSGVVVDGELKAVMTMAGGWVQEIGAWLPDGRAVGTAILRPIDIPGSTATGASATVTASLPVLVDIEAGELTPLLLFGPLFDGGGVAAPYVSNRNRVIGAVLPADTLYRVDAPEDCLYLRDRPALSAATLNCLADGALVTAPGKEPVSADGRSWAAVTSVSGEQGWASLEYLERP